MARKHAKTDRERRYEKALRHLAALIIHNEERIPIHEQLLDIIQKALKRERTPPIPLTKELRAAYDKAHPRA